MDKLVKAGKWAIVAAYAISMCAAANILGRKGTIWLLKYFELI